VIHRWPRVQHLHPPHHFVYRTEAHLRHVLPYLLGNKEEEIDDMLGLSHEVLAQRRILRRDAY
jgi:hypothetical protein